MLSFPYITDHQTVVNFANSARDVMIQTDNNGRGDLPEIHGQRVHELMHFRSHTVNTDGF